MYLTFNTNIADMMILPFTRDSDIFGFGQGLVLFLTFWQNGAWILPIIINFLVTSTLTERFHKLNREIEESVAQANISRILPGMNKIKDLPFYTSVLLLIKCFL